MSCRPYQHDCDRIDAPESVRVTDWILLCGGKALKCLWFRERLCHPVSGLIIRKARFSISLDSPKLETFIFEYTLPKISTRQITLEQLSTFK